MKKALSKPGKLIVLEGPDGVGKSTLCAAIASSLEDRGIRCQVMSFPGREEGTVGKLVYDIHHAPEQFVVSGITPLGRQTLHIAAHLDAIERRIVPALEVGTHILLDRYWWSTWVYGKVAGIDLGVLRAMIDLELAVWKDTKPAMVVLVQRDTPINRDENLDCWRRWRDEYQCLADEEAQRHPTAVLSNLGTFSDALQQALRLLSPIQMHTVSAEEKKHG